MQTLGIIRNKEEDILQVFSPVSSQLVTCYYDSHSDTYCVPDYTDSLTSLDNLHALYWRLFSELTDIKAYSPIINQTITGYIESISNGYYMGGYVPIESTAQIVLVSGVRSTETIKLVKDTFGFSLAEAKTLIENAPSVLKDSEDFLTASSIKRKFADAELVIDLRNIHYTLEQRFCIYSVILTSYNSSKIKVVKAIEEVTGLSLAEAKNLVDSIDTVPATVKEVATISIANEVADKIIEAGGSVEIKEPIFWLTQEEFDISQWVTTDKIQDVKMYNPLEATIVAGKFSSPDKYCVPGYTFYWDSIENLFSNAWVLYSKVSSTSMFNPLKSYSDIRGVSYKKDEFTNYYSHPKETSWMLKDDLYESNYRFSSNLSTVQFYNPKLDKPTVDGKLDSDSDKNYCIPRYVNIWSTLSSIYETNFRLKEGLTNAIVYNPVLNIESKLVGSSNSDYCIPGYINDWSSLENILDQGWLLTSSLDDQLVINNLLEKATCKYNSERNEYFIVGVTTNLITIEQLLLDNWRFYNNITTSKWFNPSVSSSNSFTATYSLDTDEYVIQNHVTIWSSADKLNELGWRTYNSLSNSQWYNPSNDATVVAKCNSSIDEYCIPGYVNEWKTQSDIKSLGWRNTSSIDTVTMYNPTLNPQVSSAICKFTEDGEYCIPGYITYWTSLDNIKSSGWRLLGDRSTFTVFNPSIDSQPLTTCYYDLSTDKYSVPNYTDWLTKDQMSAHGWRFVDGETNLYNGLDLIRVIEDSDSSD